MYALLFLSEVGRLSLLYLVHELTTGLESGNVVSGDYQSSVLCDVACGLLCALLEDETTEAAKEHGLALNETLLDACHQTLYTNKRSSLVHACLLRNLFS